MALRIRIKVTVPKEVFNSQAAIERIARAQREKTAPALKRYFSQTVQGWQNPPDWSQRQTITPHSIAMAVFASGQNADQYRLVNEGARPHAIFPRRMGGMLRFQPGYRAGTRPRTLQSQAFSRFGGFISTGSVQHPGFEPRAFDEAVAEAHYDDFVSDMQAALKP